MEPTHGPRRRFEPTPDEERIIRGMIARGDPFTRIEERIGITSKRLIRWAKSVGLKTHPRFFSQAAMERVMALKEQGHTKAEISRTLGITEDAVSYCIATWRDTCRVAPSGEVLADLNALRDRALYRPWTPLGQGMTPKTPPHRTGHQATGAASGRLPGA